MAVIRVDRNGEVMFNVHGTAVWEDENKESDGNNMNVLNV